MKQILHKILYLMKHLKKNDPVYSCELYLNKGCAFVDHEGFCDYPNCDMLNAYLKKKASHQKTICIDIDGTICKYDGWKGEEYFGEVLPYAAEMIQKLHDDGWFIILFSTRNNKPVISKFMHDNNIYFDTINENPAQPTNAIGGKPIADIYLDDRAITFKGNWKQTYYQIQHFKPWQS